jgi:hypothetical protein
MEIIAVQNLKTRLAQHSIREDLSVKGEPCKTAWPWHACHNRTSNYANPLPAAASSIYTSERSLVFDDECKPTVASGKITRLGSQTRTET